VCRVHEYGRHTVIAYDKTAAELEPGDVFIAAGDRVVEVTAGPQFFNGELVVGVQNCRLQNPRTAEIRFRSFPTPLVTCLVEDRS
jgi:hypothetical protein